MNDQNIALIEQECGVTFSVREGQVFLSGEEDAIAAAREAVRILLEMITDNEPVDRVRIRYVLSLVKEGKTDQLSRETETLVAPSLTRM